VLPLVMKRNDLDFYFIGVVHRIVMRARSECHGSADGSS
jgi:hypothetical protein